MAAPLVLHVLPVDLSRGAQTYARALRDALDGRGARHRTCTLFRSDAGALDADIALDVPPGGLRRAGLDLRAVRALRRELRARRPDVVVAHGGEPLKYAVLAGVTPGQLAYYKIGVGGARLAGAKRWFHRRLLDRCALVAAVSDDAAAEARELGVEPARLHVVANGRDPDVFRPGPEPPAGRPARLAFVGHLTASKRPRRYVEVVQALRAGGLAFDAVMAGDGPLLADMERAAASAGIDVLGRVEDVAGLLAGCDVFVFTSVPDGEGMPGVLIEAGLAGLAVVTTDVPGAGDVVLDGSTGFVVGVDDREALVAQARMLVADEPLRRRFGAAARQHCATRFSLAASIERWDALLAGLLGERCTSST